MFKKKIAFWVVVVFFSFVINSLVHSIWSFSQKERLLLKKEKELTRVKQENTLLKNQLTQAVKPQFVEAQARDRLFLAKPGEGVLVVSPPKTNTSAQSGKKSETRPNWLQWWELF